MREAVCGCVGAAKPLPYLSDVTGLGYETGK
jgi:hypothetical protein